MSFVTALGCWSSENDDDDSADGDSDGDGDIDCLESPTTVDLLVMVDDSGSMAQEQTALSDAFSVLADGLTDPVEDDSLHVGVISTDMGTGGFAVATCADSDVGDDGVLQHTPVQANCDQQYPTYLSWDVGDDPIELDSDFACVGTLGTGGCGFQQQLKAVRKALTTHADGPNAGFLRDDSLLAILMVTDQDDCSVREDIEDWTDIFNTQLDELGPFNLRCHSYADEYLEPIESFVEDLQALRSCADRLVVFGIVGIPPGSEDQCNLPAMTDFDYECVLGLSEMQEVIDDSAEGQGQRLVPSCDHAETGEAFPPRRLVETIRQLGNAGAAAGISSICGMDYTDAMRDFLGAVQSRLDN